MIASRFGEPFELPPQGYYLTRVGYDGGRASVGWNGRQDAKGTTRVEVQQTALDNLGLVGSVALLRDLSDVGWRSSRLDEYVDDYDRRMTPALVREAILGGQAVTHARPGRVVHDDLTGRETYYLGRPGSDRMSRCYDRPESEARYELQSRRDAAKHSVAVLLAAADPVAAVISNIVSFADYRESKARTRTGTRAARLPWWEAVVGDVARATAAPSRPAPSLDELAEYFRLHWGRRLASLYLELGPDWLNGVIRDGMSRMDEEELAS